jgi:hypothetical protein
MRPFTLDTQGDIDYNSALKKRFLITYSGDVVRKVV